MNCFDNYIGIKAACEKEVPSSGLYIEDLAGLSLRYADKMESGKYESGFQLIKDKIRLAGELVMQELRVYMEDIEMYNQLEAKIGSNFTTTTIQSTTKGLEIDWYKSPLTNLRVTGLNIKAAEDFPNAKLKIEAEGDSQIIEVNLLKDQVVNIPVNFKTRVPLTKITWISDVLVYTENISRIERYRGGCQSCGHYLYEYISMKGIDTDYTQIAYGVMPEILIECDFDNALCNVAHHLRFPVLYKAGIEVLNEWKMSDKVNYITEFLPAQVEQMINDFNGNYIEQMNAHVPSITNYLRQLDNNCINCKKIRLWLDSPLKQFRSKERATLSKQYAPQTI